MEFTNNEYVWWNADGWLYLGMDEDGLVHLYRPVRGHLYGVLEFNTIGADEFEDFYKENGKRMNSED